jgi:O-succinylbenzoate synthase
MIEMFRLHLLEIPLVRPFRTSFGSQDVRDVLLVEAVDNSGVRGWGECVTMAWPGYSSEYTSAAVHVLRDHLIPALGPALGADPVAIRDRLETLRGHPMAKAALSTALLDVSLRLREESLAQYLGASRTEVECGVSVGIPSDMEALLDEVAQYVEAGYRRIKLKIQPGWDLEPVAAVREMWPRIPVQVDANQAYTRDHARHLARLDEYGLLLIEQPLAEDDLWGHRLIADVIATPICLDESILTVASAESAIEFGCTEIVNIKPGRVGGYVSAREIHDLCRERGIPVWCGGMLETGIGRAANLALAALPNFTLPGDTSASDRYFRVDITEPFVLDHGCLAVPTGPGIGVDPIPEEMDRQRLESWEIAV